MPLTLNLKRRKWRGKREVIVILSAVILTTVGIKASDNFFNSPQGTIAEGENGCPTGMVLVESARGDFCIDKYEAAPGEDCPQIVNINQGDTRTNLNANNCRPESLPGRIPWLYISQDQAVQACARAGKRLPTPEEWYEAALGTPDHNQDWGIDDCQVANNWLEQPGLSGTGKNCLSAAGAYDMIGNVWEWVEGAVYEGEFAGRALPDPGYINSTDGYSLPGSTDQEISDENYNLDYLWIKKNGTRALARGGYWDNNSDAGQYSMYIVMPPSGVGAGIGFRCAK